MDLEAVKFLTPSSSGVSSKLRKIDSVLHDIKSVTKFDGESCTQRPHTPKVIGKICTQTAQLASTRTPAKAIFYDDVDLVDSNRLVDVKSSVVIEPNSSKSVCRSTTPRKEASTETDSFLSELVLPLDDNLGGTVTINNTTGVSTDLSRTQKGVHSTPKLPALVSISYKFDEELVNMIPYLISTLSTQKKGQIHPSESCCDDGGVEVAQTQHLHDISSWRRDLLKSMGKQDPNPEREGSVAEDIQPEVHLLGEL